MDLRTAFFVASIYLHIVIRFLHDANDGRFGRVVGRSCQKHVLALRRVDKCSKDTLLGLIKAN